MNILYKLLKQDPESRDGIIATTSVLGIITNLLVATIKVIIGVMASSVAIISEGVNNASDVLTSVLTFLGAKLAHKHPDENHPFGYGRIEYLASLIIAGLILVTGIEMVISSVKLIFNPEELSVSYLSIAIVAGSAIIKYILGVYTIKMGKKADSGSLIVVGLDCRNDSYASVITIVSALVFVIFGLNIDAYAGLIISFLILRAGYEVLSDTIGNLIGKAGEPELAAQLYKEIRSTDGILAAADMMLHNYGPDAWSGSVNVEIDHNKTVGEIYQFLHELQLRIMHEHNVTMVFGVYAVDNSHPDSKVLRNRIASFVKEREHVKSFHAVYVDSKNDTIYCDFIVDYKLRDWDGLRHEFEEYMAELYPNNALELVIETEYV